ncbi:33079_t:CDS:2, partial [Gigaspora margarita]
DYPQASDDLLRSLGYCTKSWARAFTSRYFTASVQSTSCNKGKNSTLKHLFGNLSLSLCELFEALEERPKNAAKPIFEPIIQQLNDYIFQRESYDNNKELSTTSTSHEIGLDISDTKEP